MPISYDLRPQTAPKSQPITVQGSEISAIILEKHLYLTHGQQSFDIHRGSHLTVKDYDYAQLWRLTEDIFCQAAYKGEALVADITGGTKMMSMAIAMACIPLRRRMQYMDVQRDWQGNPLPQGEMTPVMIDIDPMLYAPHDHQ